MIKSIENNSDKSIVLYYIGANYYKCLYLYIDLMYYSIERGEIKSWVQYDKDNSITLVMLQYHTALHIYSDELDYDKQELLQHLYSLNFSIICGRSELIEDLSVSMPSFTSEIGYVGRLYKTSSVEDDKAEIATLNDLKEIAELIYLDEDSGASYELNDLIRQMETRYQDGFSRNVIIRDNNRIVANISTGAEIKDIATLNNLIVRKEYRRQGLAQRVFRSICSQLLMEGKEVYSIYYVPESVSLHNKIGFIECCKYGKLFARTH